MLFVDLVGFTPLSENRDPEAVRELLSGYFERARSVISRYGGTIEKFIGDAVVAFWGAPVAREDDAERAVCAGLELTAMVAALGAQNRVPDLRARAGIVTGEAAVRHGADAEAMVIGDTVNTASRVQSVAPPGAVLVDEATARAVGGTIIFEDAGEHELKGKAEPLRAWRATRVADAGGEALETALVGRQTERQALVDELDATLVDGRARMLAMVGEAGIGKSRLGREFEHYLDGLTQEVFWHRGRSLAYGEGVAFWALAEMVKTRCGIAEEENSESARPKLEAALSRYVLDEGERRMVGPRLAALIGIERGRIREQADLFSGWRLFFERLSDEAPVALVFEDLHLADPTLLEFIDYLLEWSAAHPIFILGIGRPELGQRRPLWVDDQPGVAWLELGPLEDSTIDELLETLLPGPLESVRARIREGAGGLPLYAVEMVRMLVDRGALERRGEHYELVGAIDEVKVPETLHALIAARLDVLPAKERTLLGDAAVLGQSFSLEGLLAVSGLGQRDLRRLVEGLVARQTLTVDEDPYSAERGQYKFIQPLVQRIAYGMLSRRDRKQRHLFAAEYLERQWGEGSDEIADVLAAHYIDAVEAEPEAADASEIKARALKAMAAAGDRALDLGAGDHAATHFLRAAEFASADLERGDLLERAASAAALAGDRDQARQRFEQAAALFEARGEHRRAARVGVRVAETLYDQGRTNDALERLESAYAVLAGGEPDAALGGAELGLARVKMMLGRIDEAADHAEVASRIAQSVGDPTMVAETLINRSGVLSEQGRIQEALGLGEQALEVSLEHDLTSAELRACNLVSILLWTMGRNEEALELCNRAIGLARRRGDRYYEWKLLAGSVADLYYLGRWNEALDVLARLPNDRPDAVISVADAAQFTLLIHLARGNLAEAERDLAHVATMEGQGYAACDAAAAAARATFDRTRGQSASASEVADLTDLALAALGSAVVDSGGQLLLIESIETAIAVDDLRTAGTLLDHLESYLERADMRYLAAEADRLTARLCVRRGDLDQAERRYGRAASVFRELAYPFPLAIALLWRAEDLSKEGESGKRREEARQLFERLEARPWMERTASRQSTAHAHQPG